MSRATAPTTESAAPPGRDAAPLAATLGRMWVRWLPAVLVVLGIGLRLRQYLSRRSLWNDEAALALNVVRRGYRDLLRPLDIEQGAPLGFLWAQRTAVSLLGNDELALRLVPLCSGIAALVLFAVLARRVLTPWAVPVAVLLFATLGPLVYYSAEAKQYSSDVAVAVLLLLATVMLLDGPLSPPRAVGWGAIGCASMLVSHPSVIVLGACSLVAAGIVAARAGRRGLVALAPGVTMWVGALAALYVVSLRHLAANPSLEAFWKEGFAPQPLDASTAVPWVADVLAGLVPNPVELTAPVLVLVLAVLGAAVLVVRQTTVGLLVVAVIAAALAAGLVAAYPLKWRLALYLVPVVLLAVAASIDAAPCCGAPRPVHVVILVALATVAVHPLHEAVTTVIRPYTVTELRPVLEHVRAAAQPGDAVYVHWTGAVLYDYYAPLLGLPARGGYFSFTERAPCPDDPVSGLRARPRVWVVFAFPPMYDPADDADTSLSQFDRLGRRVDARAAPGNASAVLYDTSEGPSAAAAPRTPRLGHCFAVVPESP